MKCNKKEMIDILKRYLMDFKIDNKKYKKIFLKSWRKMMIKYFNWITYNHKLKLVLKIGISIYLLEFKLCVKSKEKITIKIKLKIFKNNYSKYKTLNK